MENVHGWKAAYRAAAGMSTSSTAGHLQVSAVERLHVSFAENMDDKFFKCVSCGKDFSKRSAFTHFTRQRHGLDANAVKGWLVVSDGTALRNGRHHKMKLTAALLTSNQSIDVQDSDEEIAAIAESLPIPRSWQRPHEHEMPKRRRLRQKTPSFLTGFS